MPILNVDSLPSVTGHGRRQVEFRIDGRLLFFPTGDELLEALGLIEGELASEVLHECRGVRQEVDQPVSGRRVEPEDSFEE